MKNRNLYLSIGIYVLSGIIIIVGAMLRFLNSPSSVYLLIIGLILGFLSTLWLAYILLSRLKNGKVYLSIAIIALAGISIFFGAVLKLQSVPGADNLLATGLVLEALGIVALVYALRLKDKARS